MRVLVQLVACRKNKLIKNIESTQKQYKAKWHESCQLQYSKTKLRQPEKTKRQVDNFDDMEAASMVSPLNALLQLSHAFSVANWNLLESLETKYQLLKLILRCGNDPSNCRRNSYWLNYISAGDLIAQDYQYHVQLVFLYNRARENKRADDSNSDEVNHDIALTEQNLTLKMLAWMMLLLQSLSLMIW